MTETADLNPANWPRYCCAILRDRDGRYLLERRPADGRAAAGLVTCFGGTRHEHEHPDACIRRELAEELGVSFAAVPLALRVRLVSADGDLIAWFYRGDAPPAEQLTAEHGIELVWATCSELAALPLSTWHAAAIDADRRGEPIARTAGAFTA